MKSIIHFKVTIGKECYVVEGIDLPVATQALTLDELAKNIQEATELCFEGEDVATFGFKSTPTLLFSFELPYLKN